MARPRAPRSPGVALVRAALVAAVLAAGPGVSALGVARSMRFRARPYLLAAAGGGVAPAATAARGVAAGASAALGGPGGAPSASAPPAGWTALPLRPPLALPEVVRQSTRESCGPAALATILAWEGRPVGESAVLARARLRADGVTLAELARLAAVFELPVGWYRVPPRDLPRLPTPFIAHLRDGGGHYVAVSRVARGFVLLADPAAGVALMRLSRFRRAWSGRVMLLRAASSGVRP